MTVFAMCAFFQGHIHRKTRDVCPTRCRKIVHVIRERCTSKPWKNNSKNHKPEGRKQEAETLWCSFGKPKAAEWLDTNGRFGNVRSFSESDMI